MTFVEKLARAAEVRIGGEFTALGHAVQIEVVRAVLQAMREPSEEIYNAGWSKMPIDQSGEFCDPDSPLPIWQSMIDAALQSEEA